MAVKMFISALSTFALSRTFFSRKFFKKRPLGILTDQQLQVMAQQICDGHLVDHFFPVEKGTIRFIVFDPIPDSQSELLKKAINVELEKYDFTKKVQTLTLETVEDENVSMLLEFT